MAAPTGMATVRWFLNDEYRMTHAPSKLRPPRAADPDPRDGAYSGALARTVIFVTAGNHRCFDIRQICLGVFLFVPELAGSFLIQERIDINQTVKNTFFGFSGGDKHDIAAARDSRVPAIRRLLSQQVARPGAGEIVVAGSGKEEDRHTIHVAAEMGFAGERGMMQAAWP